MGIKRQTVAEMYDEAAEKLAAVYRKWEYGAVEAEFYEAEVTVGYERTAEGEAVA